MLTSRAFKTQSLSSIPSGSNCRRWIARLIISTQVISTLVSGDIASAADESRLVASWGFGQEESTHLQSHGGVHRDIPGPRPELYPDFAPDNTAVRLDGKGARFTFADPGVNSSFDFTNGDQITLEAWVKIDEINEGDNVYVIGKGRTESFNVAIDNQNWALRLRMLGGRIHSSFLFSSIPQPPQGTTNQANWHRWTSDRGFKQGTEWHHVAIAYEFGKPESLVAVIDGQPVNGTWDVGGATSHPPTVDNDAIWIGSALGGAPQNSFRGNLDEIAIHRQALAIDVLKSRYRGPNLTLLTGRAAEVMPEMGPIPEGEVQFTFHEGMPAHFRWLNDDEVQPPLTLKWTTDAFLFDRIPQRYDAWGIRDRWKAPVLVRVAADVHLDAGQHRFLTRVRGLSRLWVNGEVIARGGPMKGSQDGFEPITPPLPAPKPGLRIAEHRQQEIFSDYKAPTSGRYRVILETIVGGRDFRADPGEACVAIQSADGSSFSVLQSGIRRGKLLTNHAVTELLAQQRSNLLKFDDERRRTAAQSQAAFWKLRHDIARQWATESQLKQTGPRTTALSIDGFIATKIEHALAVSSQTSLAEAQQFHTEVLPILRDHCFRCHGEKSQGGFNLKSRETALAGGDSGPNTIVPGDPHHSELMARIRATSAEERMPPGGAGLDEQQIVLLDSWIKNGAKWPAPPVTNESVQYPAIISDEAFLRRVALDTVGVVPTEADIRDFVQNPSASKRRDVIEELLADDRWADHWTSYWMDVLAENPTLLNASLNTTGPFRWFIYDSFRDNKSIDRFVTELILLKGDAHEGGSAGFGIASNNDAPFAAKGQIVASAFLGIELQCARCHDSPYHSTKQRDLYALAAMFVKKPVTVPAGSRVPAAFFENQLRESLIKVTLKPGEQIAPVWPFAEATGSTDDESLVKLLQTRDDPREKLAALVTSPRNHRFAEVIVNRVWRRFIGTGLIEQVDDWEGKTASHPELLKWLANDFVSHDYDLKHLARRILNSELYQREAVASSQAISPDQQFFVAPTRRRLTAEQLVDSLCVAAGIPLDVEEMTFAPEGGRRSEYRITLGVPERAWQFASLGNERDRPSLSLPRARAIADIMEAFGWNGARQNPRTDRESSANVLQPGVLQNSDAVILLTRASAGSGLASIAIEATSPQQLLESIFLRFLGRLPSSTESALLGPLLAEDFDDRLLSLQDQKPTVAFDPLPTVTWSNHVQPESNTIAVELERRARLGPPSDPRLRPEWREVYEDVVWSVVNLGEFVWIP